MPDAAKPAELREKAVRFRQLVEYATDKRIIDALLQLADEYEATAESLENEHPTSET